ncbi:MAG: hypothetical protein AAF502_17845 [Bacteroidota bacterium]
MTGKPWAQHFGEIARNPGEFINGHWIWLLVIILTLFILSRMNNYMEVSGVNKAIIISRGIVSTFMAFILAPIVFMLLLNVYAFFNGLPLINMRFIWEWIVLTATTFYWLLKCIGMPRGEVMYDLSGVIRVLWFLLPTAYIWLRTASSGFWRMMLIPFVISTIYLTAYKAAPPTFFNKYIPVEWQDIKVGDQKGPTLNDQIKAIEEKTGGDKNDDDKPTAFDNQKKKLSEDANKFYKKNTAYISGGIFILLAFALALGYLTKFKILSLLLTGACIFGFYMMMQSSPSAEKLENFRTPNYAFYELVDKFEAEYKKKGESMTAHKYAIRLNEMVKTGKYELPKYFCQDYKLYFYDYCLTPPPPKEKTILGQ